MQSLSGFSDSSYGTTIHFSGEAPLWTYLALVALVALIILAALSVRAIMKAPPSTAVPVICHALAFFGIMSFLAAEIFASILDGNSFYEFATAHKGSLAGSIHDIAWSLHLVR